MLDHALKYQVVSDMSVSHVSSKFVLKYLRSVLLDKLKKHICKDVTRGGALGGLSHQVKFKQDTKI